MPRVSHHFIVDRPIELVFDIVTTARFWPEWHPATQGVEGDIDHPARLGDRILDFPELGPQIGAAMEAQSAEGVASLARLVEREVPTPAEP